MNKLDEIHAELNQTLEDSLPQCFRINTPISSVRWNCQPANAGVDYYEHCLSLADALMDAVYVCSRRGTPVEIFECGIIAYDTFMRLGYKARFAFRLNPNLKLNEIKAVVTADVAS